MRDSVKISGKKLELVSAEGWNWSRRPGGWWLGVKKLSDGSVVRRRAIFLEKAGKFWANVGGDPLWGEVVEANASVSGDSGSGEDFVAQFPGKVKKVLVSDGSTVEEGDSLVLVEAMKMEFAIKAPSKGVVRKIRVKEGQLLSPGDQFLDWEADHG